MQRVSLGGKKVIFVFFIIAALFFLNMFSQETRGKVYGISAPFQSWLFSLGQGASDFFAGFYGTSLLAENEELRKENTRLQQELVVFLQTKLENKELRKTLELGLPEEFQLVAGEIVGREISGNTIFFNKGTKDGVQKGFSVITPEKVLVGKVLEVFKESALVQLLSHSNTSFDAKVSEKGIVGVLRGQGGSKAVLDLVLQEVTLEQGDIVVTSNLTGLFPPNLLVGTIKEVQSTDQAVFQKATIDLFFDLSFSPFIFVIIP